MCIAIVLIGVIAYQIMIQSNMNDEPIRIQLSEWSPYDHVFIAKEKGIFEKNGVNVEITYDQQYITALNKYARGEMDGIFMSMTDVIYETAAGHPTKLVYITDYSVFGDVIVSKFNLADLKNKKIGVDGFGTFSHLFILKTLELNGMSEKDIEFVIIPAPETLDALEENRIDAGHTWGITRALAIEKGYNVIATVEPFPYLITSGLAFNAETIEKRPEDIQKVVNSLVEAREFFYSNQEESIQIMAAGVNQNVDEYKKRDFDGGHFINIAENKKLMNLTDGHLVNSVNEVSNFFFKLGQISHIPDIDDLVDPQFVNRIT